MTADRKLDSYPADVQRLARGARRLIRQVLPGIEERADASAPVLGYGYGPGYRGLVCTLILSRSGVKLGLVRGAELADPRHLLEGSGRVHRYIPIRTAADLRQPGLRQLIKSAHAHWQARKERA